MIGSRVRWFGAATVLSVLVGAVLLRQIGDDVRSPAPSAVRAASEGPHDGPARRLVSEPALRSAPLGGSTRTGHSDAKSLTELAERSDDPRVIVATLEALGTTYAARSTRKPAPDAALERVLVRHLGSEQATVVRAALETARVSLLTERPAETVVSEIVGLSGKDEAASRRVAALEALNFIRPDRRAAQVLTAFETALDAEQPELVSLGLLGLSQSGPSLDIAPEATRAALAARVVALLGHGNPGVRGRALLVLAELPGFLGEKERYAAGYRALLDREPYVCAQAADLLARCRKTTAIHRLIDAVTDLRETRYELLYPYPTLDGGRGVLVHEVPGRRRVAEAMLLAIQALSETPGLERLTLTLRDRHSNETLVLQNAGSASSWYLRNRTSIPRD